MCFFATFIAVVFATTVIMAFMELLGFFPRMLFTGGSCKEKSSGKKIQSFHRGSVYPVNAL